MKIPSAIKIAKMIELPLEDWKGRCAEIATKAVSYGLIKGYSVYGHWLGPVSRKSFFADRLGMPFIQHGWIRTFDDKIIDLTRWVFEAKKPYIYEGDNSEGYYDEGGNQWRESQSLYPPKPNKKERKMPCVLSSETKSYISDLLEVSLNSEIDFGQLCWLANSSPKTLGIHTKEIYQWIINIGQSALMPLDNRLMIIKK